MAVLTNPQINLIRLARATNVRHEQGVMDIKWLDNVSGFRRDIPITQPYAARGWGILCGIEEGTICVVNLRENKPYVVATIPHNSFYRVDVADLPQTSINESRYFIPQSGEVVLQSKPNSIVHLDNRGNIELSTPEGNAIRIDRERDAITQISANIVSQCEAGTVIAGQVHRDIRSPEERTNDVVFAGFEELQGSGLFDRIVGLDPQDDIILEKNSPPKGLFNPRGGSIGSYNNPSTSLNPSLTEWDFSVPEFSDGNIGIDNVEPTTAEKAKGYWSKNLLMRITLGTVVNTVGRQTRFDYGFGVGGQGHGSIFANEQFFSNTVGYSTDWKFNEVNTLNAPQINARDFEWTVNRLNEVNFATAARFVVHTKGADHRGRQEDATFRGNPWALQIDKEGFTKLNIPAATDGGIIDRNDPSSLPIERFRRGRSLLMNMDGSATVAIGKENTTTLQTNSEGLSIDDGLLGITKFPLVNRRNSREDRSLTLDTLGNMEAFIGADEKAGQSVLLQTDGSISMLVGKENRAPEDGFAVLTEVYNDQGQGRQDRSFTGSLLGNLELLVGKDEVAEQSIMLQTLGGNNFKFGVDADDNSVQVDADGGIKIEIRGANNNEYSLELSAQGNLKIVTQGNFELEAQEAILNAQIVRFGDEETAEAAIKGATLVQYLATHTHGNGNMGDDTTPPLQSPSSSLSEKITLS